MSKKYLSWNVNGVRAALNKGFQDFFNSSNADIICLQETKAQKEQVEMDFNGYYDYWNSAVKKGYSGTAVFSKVEPLDVQYGMGIEKHDQEGRIITLEFEDHFLVNVYTPNAKHGLLRLPYREKEWDVDFLNHLKKLEDKKPVVFCGDLNVAHTEIDLANPKSNENNPGFTVQERQGFTNLVNAGFLDTFREFTKEGGHYSWWTFRSNARERNIGWRIDYFGISASLRPRLQDAFILPEVYGSDHCPVGILLD